MSNANAWHSAVGEFPHVSGHEDAIVERLEQLVSIESPSGDVDASARIADSLVGAFESLGGAVRRVVTDTGTNLVVDVPGSGEDQPVLLIGHSDTVWPAGTLAGAVPLRRDADAVYGPGAFDMKNGLVIIEWALRLLGGAPRRAARVVVTCDEELGSPTSQHLVEEAARGCRGALGFEAPHPDGALKVGRRGSTRVQVDVTGREAHAALDADRGISAIDELVDQLLAVRRIVAEAGRRVPVLCNVGTIDGGTRANVVAGRARAQIGLRFVDRESQERTLRALGGLAPLREGARVGVRVISSRTAWQPHEADWTWLRRIAGVAERLGVQATGRPAAGAGDANLVGALGVPTVDGLGGRGGGAHAVGEHVQVSSVFQRIELVRSLLKAD